MKRVFDNRMCAHIWAQQTQDEGRSNNGNLYFRGATIYSYGSHFPLGVIYQDKAILNSSDYSNSTAEHKGYVRSAVRQQTVLYTDTRTIRIFADASIYAERELKSRVTNLHTEHVCQQYDLVMKKAAKARQNLPLYLRQAEGILYGARNFFNELGWTVPDTIQRMIEEFTNNQSGILQSFKQRLAEIDAANKKREAEALEKAKFAALLWRENKTLSQSEKYDLQRSEKIFLRINEADKRIETSKGAVFPIEHAKRAFVFIKETKMYINNEKGALSWDDKNLQLGHFRIDKIFANGDVKAGCHFVEWDEIERCARALNIYP